MKRKDIEEKYKWDLSLVLKSDNEFFASIKEIKEKIASLVKYKGKLTNSDNVYLFFKQEEDLDRIIDRVYLYAFLKKSADGSDSVALKLYEQAQNAFYEVGEKLSFVQVELSKLDEKVLKSFLKEERFKNYDRTIDAIIRNKPHILSEPEEVILSQIGKFADFDATFDCLDNVEIKFAPVKLSDGKKVPLTNASYSVLIKDDDRNVRRQVHNNLHKGFSKFNLTLSQNYINYLKKCEFFAKTYKFKSCFDSALFHEEVDKSVYENLIKSVHTNLPLFYDFVEEKRKKLNIDKINIYDMYATTAKGVDFNKSFEESFEIVKKVLAPMGNEYLSILDKAKDNRWIDVFPSDGKDSGAFSISCDTGNPFVMLNFAPCYNEISTMAHELGHAMHSYYSDKTQPYAKRDYVIFVAEVASTVNELLLDRYFLKNGNDKGLKRYIIDSILGKYYSTIFRQTMFSEFEYKAHDLVVKNKPIAFDELNKIYSRLQKLYFGPNVERSKYAKYEWSRIPHFYRSFYVYKYATGLIAAIIISDKLINEKGYFEKYKKFLSGGCSTDPISLLKLADVDMMNKKTFDNAFNFYRELIDEYKKI